MRRILSLALISLFMAALTGSASARDVFDLQISPQAPTAEHRYEGFVASAPVASGPEGGYRPDVCRQAQYCDTIDLDITVPDSFDRTWELKVTLSWPFLSEDTAAEDMDMWLFESPNESTYNSISGSQAATGANPETMLLTNLDPGRYYIVVLNFSGVEEYYDIKAEFLPGEARFRRTPSPAPRGGSGPRPAPEPTSPEDDEQLPPAGPVEPPLMSPPPILDEGTRRTPPPLAAGTEGNDSALSGIPWDGGRAMMGALILAVLGFAAYILFFANPRPKTAIDTGEPGPPAG